MPRGILPLISCPAGVARLKAKEEYHTPLVRGNLIVPLRDVLFISLHASEE